MLKDLLQKEWFRLVGVLLIGITIGVIFYPSKRIEERLSQKHQEEISLLKDQSSKEKIELNEKLSIAEKQTRESHIQSEQKISKLTEEIKTLQSKQKTSYFKLIKPDGTVEIKKFTESEITESSKVISSIQEEFKQKIDSIEIKWSTIHQERLLKIQREFELKENQYKKTINELEYSKVTQTNEKKFGIEAGITSDKNYYGHATIDIWGPTFIGLHGEVDSSNTNNKLGVGLGLRF